MCLFKNGYYWLHEVPNMRRVVFGCPIHVRRNGAFLMPVAHTGHLASEGKTKARCHPQICQLSVC